MHIPKHNHKDAYNILEDVPWGLWKQYQLQSPNDALAIQLVKTNAYGSVSTWIIKRCLCHQIDYNS